MKKSLKIITLTLLITSSLSACINLDGSEKYAPQPFQLRNLPEGNDSFSQGFRDGCYNFVGQMGFGAMRFYDAPVKVGFIYDNLYRQGYEHGDRYCGVYVNKNTTL